MADGKTVAMVNGEAIPEEAVTFELQRLAQFYMQQGMPEAEVREQLPMLRQRALDQAIGAKLLIEEARRLQLPVGGDELDAAFERYVKQVGSKEKLLGLLKEQGLSEEAFRQELKQGRMVDKLVEQACAGTPMPTEDEIKAHFEQHEAEYCTEDRVLAQHILVSAKDATEASKLAARQKLEEIRNRIVNGKAEFAAEAAEHSECPSGKSNGGSLGWFGRGMMVPAFDKVVFDMALNTVSDIVETQFGYHIILKTGEEKGKKVTLDEVHDKVRDFLFHTRRGQAVEAYVQELRAKADVQILPMHE